MFCYVHSDIIDVPKKMRQPVDGKHETREWLQQARYGIFWKKPHVTGMYVSMENPIKIPLKSSVESHWIPLLVH